MRTIWLLLLFSVGIANAMQRPLAKEERKAIPPSPLPVPAAFAIPSDTRFFVHNPNAGGVTISPEDGRIEPYAGFSISFPTDIVGTDAIDRETTESPVVAWPPLDGVFYWRSPSEGEWMVRGPRIPGQVYRLRLRDSLVALDGSPLPIESWGVELPSDPLRVSCWYDERDALNSRPVVPLEFNYPLRVHDVAEGIWFQDRASRARFPVEVRVDAIEEGLPTPARIRVSPREPLPVGAFYDLIVEGVHDAYAGRGLSYPRVFPLGRTRPLAVDYVVARNEPQGKPHIEIKFRTPLADEPLLPGAVTVEPPVHGMSLRKDFATIFVDGDFDPSIRYKVTMQQAVKGDRGFAMAANSLWGATFHPKPATLLFPPGELRQRSELGFRFAFIQCNTGPVTWRLARVSDEKVASILATLDRPAKSGDPLLVDEFAMPTVASGETGGVSGDREELRKVEVLSSSHLAGPYLFEASATGPDGARIANRSLIWFSGIALTQKQEPGEIVIRAAGMANGLPVSGLRVELLTKELVVLGEGRSDAGGVLRFARSIADAAAFFRIVGDQTTTLWPASPGSRFPSGSSYFSPKTSLLGKVMTDRPLYRPGQELRIKGFVRDRKVGSLAIPAGREIEWEIVKAWQNEALVSGKSRVNSNGGWDASWTIPGAVDLGEFRVRAKLGPAEAGMPTSFRVEEFRNPPFSVLCTKLEPDGPGESVVKVASQYFHGAPNVGSRVKWKATWISDHDGFYYPSEDGFEQVDLFSEAAKAPVFDLIVEGETALDGNGEAVLRSRAPFVDVGNRASAEVYWQADVTGPDGQTITGGTTESVTMNPLTLGVREVEEAPDGILRFEFRLLARDAGTPLPATIPTKLFLVKTKSLKEIIAPFVYRYRNTQEFTEVASQDVQPGAIVDFPAQAPGRYVLVAGPVEGGIKVSVQADVTGPGEAEYPVQTEETLVVNPPKSPVQVGKTARFDVISPTGGIAWVTVETDRVLDSQTIELPGNATKIEIPTKAGFAPNAWLSVYLLRPGGASGIPGELFGYAAFTLEDPATTLNLAPLVGKPGYEPREKISGSVTVTSGGAPVAGAEVTVYAVDDSILELGGWTLPTLLPAFYPENNFNVVTSPALQGLAAGVLPQQLTQKGYIVGDGGGEEFGNVAFTRKDFKPILFWKPSLITDGNGTVRFETVASDDLTRYRVVALAQTAKNQFGSASTTFEVTKSLMIEPALPRFLREGDEIELRAVARQNLVAEETLDVRCETNLPIGQERSMQLAAKQDAPVVARFRAKTPEAITSSTVRFDVAAKDGRKDSVEVVLPVLPRTITVDESVSGAWDGDRFDVRDYFPETWQGVQGTYDLTISTSAWLTKLMGIPGVLDYPHGCFEQQSSRVLVFTALADLLKWLPADAGRDEAYRRAITEAFRSMETSLLPGGLLPYWEMGTTGSLFVTIQSALAVSMAEEAGFEVPERLSGELAGALQAIASRSVQAPPSLRVFALFVLAATGSGSGLESQADELYLERDRLTVEDKAMLALVFTEMEHAPQHARQLVSELPANSPRQAFDPMTFSSGARSEAFCAMARMAVDPGSFDDGIRTRLGELMESSASLSTQENLWLLLAFKSALAGGKPVPLGKALSPLPAAVSANRSSAEWGPRPLNEEPPLRITGLGKSQSGKFVVRARRQLAASEIEPVQRDLKLSRLVKNLTDASRTGTPESPFRLGDELLVTYRFQAPKPQSFLALEDNLPAGVEVLNPDLALFGKFYQVPEESGVATAVLSHSQLRDSRACLYFDEVGSGLHSYSVLARATAAGTFSWPAAQISPMYDSRFYARTAPATCVVSGN